MSKIEIFSDFAELSEANIRRLNAVCQCLDQKEFKKGDVIIREGDKGDELYILYDGAVQIKGKTPHDEEFAIIDFVTSKMYFLENWLLSIKTDVVLPYMPRQIVKLCL